jgi:hypothetical protein
LWLLVPLGSVCSKRRVWGLWTSKLLGPVEVGAGPRRLVLGEPKPRALPTVLLLHANRVVSTDRRTDELWAVAKDRADQWSKPQLPDAQSRAPPDQELPEPP